jgi:CheY-like chemotaxis protein
MQKEGSGAPKPMHRSRILVVHHERAIAEFICQYLLREGYETRMECSSTDAIQTAAEWVPQLLIIDPVMPGISGVDATKQINDRTKCKVLLVSAGALETGFSDILDHLRKHGCDCAAFPLPFEKEELLEHVRQRIDPPLKAIRAEPVTGNTRANGSSHTQVLQLKTCPNCHRKVLSLITDNATGKRYCYHCIPNPENCPGVVYVTRKMDELNAAGKLETYPPEQRIKDMNNPPRCSVCGGVSDEELCSKCDGEAFMLAHRQRPKPKSADDRPVPPDGHATLGAVPDADLVQPRDNGEAKNRPTTLISLETIDALLRSANIVTRMEGNSLTFKGFIGETRIEISPSGFRTAGGLEISEIIRIESQLEKMPVTWNEGLLCAVNMAASNGALTVDSDGKLRIKSKVSVFSEEPREVTDVYIGIIFLGAIIHTNALQASMVDAFRMPISKAEPLPDSHVDGVWAPAGFERTVSLMRKGGVFSNGDDCGLTAEFAWDVGAGSAIENLLGKRRKRTSLLRIECMEHPNLGKGLFCRLELPLNLSDAEAFKLAIELNKMECTAADWPPFLGAWTSKPGSGRPTYVSFWPNYFSKVVSLELISTWHAARAKRVPEWVRSNTGIR